MRQAYRYELDPNNAQRSLLMSFAGTSRFAWNWGLEEYKRCLGAEGEKLPTGFDLINLWNRTKDEAAPWHREVASEVPEQALRDLDRTFRTFWRGRKQRRLGFPRFKSKGKCRDSFRVRLARAEGRRVRIPRIGWVRVKESTDKLDGRITSATVSRVADRWFISFAVERDRMMPPARTGPAVGIDLGINRLATLSDGTTIENPAALKSNLRKLQRLGREVSRKQKGSNNRAKAAMKLARHHARVSNIRRDAIHKATTHLARTKPVLVIEDLNVSGMVKNRSLARSISDAGFSEFRRQLTYKADWYGATLIVTDRFMPSSKTCSECGTVKTTLSLSERTFRCEDCGIVLDRDLNAALNLAAVAVRLPGTLNACGGDVRPASTGADSDEAGTRLLSTA